MAYCRFSTDDFQCDLYVYASVEGGYRTCVAARRTVYAGELPAPAGLDGDPAAFAARHHLVAELRRRSPRVAIDLPEAGGSFWDATAGELLARLLHLRAAGLRFPDCVLDAVAEEAAEQDGVGPHNQLTPRAFPGNTEEKEPHVIQLVFP